MLVSEVSEEESLLLSMDLEITSVQSMPSSQTHLKASTKSIRFVNRSLAESDGEIKEIFDTVKQHILHFGGDLIL